MKQGTKKLISLMLAVILALSLGSVSMAAVEGDIPTARVAPGTTGDGLSYGQISNNTTIGGKHAYVKQVTYEPGVLHLEVRGNKDQIIVGLYKDAALNDPVGWTNGSAPTMSVNAIINKMGTYFIGIWANNGFSLECAANFIPSENRDVSNQKTIYVGQVEPQTNYFKFKAEKTGYLEVTGSAAGNMVTLCDKNQKALSGETEMGYNPTYGVTKGTVYYIKVRADWSPAGGYSLTVNNQKIADKSGKTKSKAASLKKKDTKKGVILAGSSQADWYKFKLKKKKKVSILFDKMRTNGKFKITVYRGSKRVASGKVTKKAQGAHVDSKGKWQKGTYYIKIERANKKSSGYYTVSWQ